MRDGRAPASPPGKMALAAGGSSPPLPAEDGLACRSQAGLVD